MGRGILGWVMAAAMVWSVAAQAEVAFQAVPLQFIAALAEPGETSGINAQLWGGGTWTPARAGCG